MARPDQVAKYYDGCAPEYDVSAGYTDPLAERTRAAIKARYQEVFRDRDVLEIACGTGYWTAVIAETARSVLATDISPAMVAIARERLRPHRNVQCRVANAYYLRNVPGGFTAAFAHWWWSHMPRSRWQAFVRCLHTKLTPGAVVTLVDQLPSAYEARGRRFVGRDCVEERALGDGRTFSVIKNFPTEKELRDAIGRLGDALEYVERTAEHSWTLTYRAVRA